MPRDPIPRTGEAMPGRKFLLEAEPLWSRFSDPFLRQAFRRGQDGPGSAPAAASPIPRPKPLKPASEALRVKEAIDG